MSVPVTPTADETHLSRRALGKGMWTHVHLRKSSAFSEELERRKEYCLRWTIENPVACGSVEESPSARPRRSGGLAIRMDDMSVTVDHTLIEAVQHIAPVIRAHNEEAERERRLSKPVLDALYEAGLFRMFTPRSLAGLEADPLTCARVIEEVSTADSVAGWSLFNPLAWVHLCARLPDAGTEEIFGRHPRAVLAGPFHPPIQAVAVDGGYRVPGRSSFASNCRDATWIAVTAMVMDGDTPRLHASGAPEVLAVFFPSEACEILDTWYVLGMRGTGSDDIAVREVFVPRTRTCPLVPEFAPGLRYQGPLYRLPAMGAITATFPSIVLAIAHQAIDAVSALVQGKTPFGSTTVLRARASAQARLAQAEGALRAARAHWSIRPWARRGSRPSRASGRRSRRRQICYWPPRRRRAVRRRRWS